MFGPLLIGLALVVFFLLMSSVFFQLYNMEKRLDDSLRNAEIYLLKQFGEAPIRDRNNRNDQDEDD